MLLHIMSWLRDYQLFLFDFDGLLVDSEKTHYQAYRTMCRKRGCTLPWNFDRYCLEAHLSQNNLWEALYRELPALRAKEPNWQVLYEEKKAALQNQLRNNRIEMMPGAKELLLALQREDIPRCVVTNSSDEQVDIIRRQNPVLDSIPFWFTRNSYARPKPDPECYVKAVRKLGRGAKKIIGFEDSPKGIYALLATGVEAVLVTEIPYPQIDSLKRKGVRHLKSLTELVIDPH